MNKRLFPSLAAQGMRANRRFYYPYLAAVLLTAAGFYNVCAISCDEGISAMRGADYVVEFCTLGSFLVAIFALIFVFYTNSFLMKRRMKELALYHVLGMGKGHIALILFWETVFTALIGVCGGLVVGILLHKLLTLALFRLLRLEVPFGFSVSYKGAAITAIWFGAILLLTFANHVRRVTFSRTIELLHSGSAGEREPKTRWLLAVLGVAALGGGYGVAALAGTAVEAVVWYFPAVFLVVIGTYCLFTSVSIAVLKLLRKNKRFYYRTRHFIGVSGMLYRMKQNAVGLANICILSTMVLVMLSGTLSLYLGMEEVTNRQAPADLIAACYYLPDQQSGPDVAAMAEKLTASIEEQGLTVESCEGNYFSVMAVDRDGGSFNTDYDWGSSNLVFITAEDYAALAGQAVPALAEDEALVYGLDEESALQIYSGDELLSSFTVKAHLDEFPAMAARSTVYSGTSIRVVVRDRTVLESLNIGIWYEFRFDTDGSDTEQIACAEALDALDENLDVSDTGQWEKLYFPSEARAQMLEENMAAAGGFLFLGIFLGLLFMMAAVLIIYYKQISEGYADRAQFQIMRKVGLSQADIRASVRGQILTVFFLPLAVACAHVAVDFRLVTLLLSIFQVYDTAATAACTLAVIAAFAILYAAVFRLTARAYYRIVS